MFGPFLKTGKMCEGFMKPELEFCSKKEKSFCNLEVLSRSQQA